MFEIGWDYACHGIPPPPEVDESFLQGHREALNKKGRAASDPDPFLRKWLSMRLSAAKRDRAVDEGVTPDYLRTLYHPVCPVRHVKFTIGTGGLDDWSLDRLCNDGAYCPGNLVFMTTGANKAKGVRALSHIIKIAQMEEPAFEGLSRIEWVRMLALMRPAYDQAGLFPYRMLLPLVQYPAPDQPIYPEDALQLAIIMDLKGRRPLIGKLRDKCPNPGATFALHKLVMKAKRRFPKMRYEHVFSDVPTYRCLLELDRHVSREWWIDTAKWIFGQIGTRSANVREKAPAFRLETRGYDFS